MDINDVKKSFSDKLSLKLNENGVVVSQDTIDKMADEFCEAIIEFKLKVAAPPDTPINPNPKAPEVPADANMLIVNGEIAWTPSRQKLIDDLASKLDDIFKPIGGIKPGDKSAFWSQKGKVQAELAGLNLEKTSIGYLLEQTSKEITAVITPKAYSSIITKEDPLLDFGVKECLSQSPLSTATNIGIWNAISKLYAQGSSGDAHVYLVDGMTSYQSVFWNT